ncbi:MAG: hypothetical protein E7308_04875 [Butyrivibrio sp.]|nr:hypothetical protein [Butyrivibrio sp.]
MALWQAKRACKDVVFVSPHYDDYIRFSRLARNIYSEYTDRVEPYGLDESWRSRTCLHLYCGWKRDPSVF